MGELDYRYEYFLFDWDGCLAKTLDDWLAAHRKGIANYGGEPDDEIIMRHLGDTKIAQYFGIEEWEDCYDHITDIGNDLMHNVDLYEGAHEVLETCSHMGRLAIISNCPRVTLEHGIDFHGLRDNFDVILSRNDVDAGKPDPESIDIALSELAADHSRSIMIGDSLHDIGAAKAAGIDSAVVYHADNLNKYSRAMFDAAAPTIIVDDLYQLQAELLKPPLDQD